MKVENKYNEIRRLLSLWEEGMTTNAETERLDELLHSLHPVPEEFESVLAVFDAFRKAEEDEVSLPSDYEKRINAALEAEIASSRLREGRGMGTVLSFFRRRRVRMAIGGIAVCLAGVFITSRMMNDPALRDAPSDAIAGNALTSGNIMADTLNITSPAVSGDDRRTGSQAMDARIPRQDNDVRSRGTGKRLPVRPHNTNPSKDGLKSYDQNPDEADYEYLSREEERMLAQNNYRVVRSEREADELLSSILGRLDSNVAMESNNIARIGLELESEMMRISDMEEHNNYNENKENDYEYIPL